MPIKFKLMRLLSSALIIPFVMLSIVVLSDALKFVKFSSAGHLKDFSGQKHIHVAMYKKIF